ncbi:MAG: hypothetical protein IAF38_06555 [Bacteroidia bacterium]|nr:hypothetical protein [Bacteroidia bacterium]
MIAKKIGFICLGLVMTGLIKAQEPKDAVGYMDVIGKEFKNIQEVTWDYTTAVAHGKSAKKVEKKRDEVLASNKAAINKISRLKAWNGSSALRDSALSYLNTNYAVLNHDFAKLVDMEEVAEQSYDLMEAYMLAKEKANEKLRIAGDMVDVQYDVFAAANNIKLIEGSDKLSKNIEIANQVYKHYNEVYLVFFKSYKQEAYLMAAMEKNDVNGIEQNKNALAKTAADGLVKIAAVPLYKNDKSLVIATTNMLNFYKDEAEKKLSNLSKFYVSKENFQKIKAAFDAKPQNQRKKEDVDQYNKAAEEANKESNNYNQVNNELNQKRTQLLDAYNKTNAAFTDKHVPQK